MVQSPLSFSATEQFRKKLMASNLEPYFVVNSKTPDLQKSDVGTKETNWIEAPLINQQDLANSSLFEKTKLNVINQYGPENGFAGPYSVFVETGKPNQGEFNFRTDNTNKFIESSQEQKELIVLNQFGPQNGWTDGASQLENSLAQFKIRGEYFGFTPSTYTPGDILLELDPTGSEGSLSQDSSLAQISAKNLKYLFEQSIALETYKLTLGRANALNAINDPYLGLRIATGRASIVEPDFQLTVPSTLIGRGFDLISRLTNQYSPYSYIPGDYFTQVKPVNLINQAVNFVGGLFGFPSVLPDRKSSSDVFLSYTGGGTRRKLFGLLDLNKFAPDYRANFLGDLNLNAPKGNYYVGNRTSEPLDIVSPSGSLPVDEYGVEIQSAVFGNGVLGDLYENDIEFKFGLGSTTTIDGGGLQGGFTWVSPKYKGNAGFRVGQGGDQKGQDPNFPPLNAQYSRSESTQYGFKKGSILDDTQRLINSQPNGGKRLQHVGNAIDQVSKVFNDGYREITKGSRVIKYVDNNGVFRGEEYGRIFAKDIPYYENTKLQKTDGNIRKNPYSILDKTYNLNIYPTTGPDSTTIVGGQVKKYMLSLENLAWRTSRRPGLRYSDLPETEKGPNGGRIMWFPPYDVGFAESNTVSWEGNEFLGRPEAIYTYRGTQRGGTLNFKIIVDHPSVMNMVVNRVLANSGSGQLADQVLESFFAGLTKFDVYELTKRFNNFSQTEIQQIQNIVNNSSNPERVKDTVNSNLNKGGDGAGGSMESNATVGIQNYTPQLGSFLSSQFFFDYNLAGGTDYATALASYQANPEYNNINVEQRNLINNSFQNLQNYCNNVNSLLSTNNNVVVTMQIKSSVSFNETGALKQERNTCIEQTITNILKGLGTDLKRVNINKVLADDDITIQPQNFKCDTSAGNYETGPVGCRRVIIDSIIELPLPNTKNPNGGVSVDSVDVVDALGSLNLFQRSLNEAIVNNNSNVTETISKQVIRKLLNEGSYFEFIKENNPFIYDSLRQKLKFFHPAFHSMTPEGLNERLTFLLQCTRPGDTIPTKKSDGTFIDKDARNTSFGAPPVCVLRIGDFYHSKVIVESVNFTYDDAKFDLNPEGIGVQPMIVGVSMGFKFIGGQSLRGPIEELQNALSFNFFANTEMYDERATVLDVSAYNKQFVEKTEQTGDTPKSTNTNLQNEGGNLIGDIDGDFGDSGTTANNSYKNVFTDLLEGYDKQTRGLYDKLKEVATQYNHSVLKLYTKSASFNTGKLGATDVNIFGKSNYIELVNQVFDQLLTDINNNSLTIISNMLNADKNKFKEADQNKFKQQLSDLVTKTKSSFLDKLSTITNDLSESQYDLIRTIDKLNYVTQSLDGYIDKKGNQIIFDTQSASTITELSNDSIQIINSVNSVKNEFITEGIITSDYDIGQTYQLLNTNGFTTAADKRFYLVFGYELVNDYKNFETKVLGTLNKTAGWDKFVTTDLDSLYRKPAVTENKSLNNLFKKVEKTGTKPNTALPSDWNKLRKKDRENSLVKKTSPTDTEKKQLQNLYLGYNSSVDDSFNGKVVF